MFLNITCVLYISIPAWWYFDISVIYLKRLWRVKFVINPARFLQQQYLWNITIKPTAGCYNWDIQATGLDAWASRVKCPARFVSHLHEICIYIWVVYSLCFFCCLFITVTWWYVWCFGWASGNQEEVQACLVTLCLFIISCYSLYKTPLGLLCSWFENNPHFHKYSMDFHV